MKIIEWISLASSLGTLSAALVALFTLLELFRQRKASYKPDLCILQRYFDLKGGECGQKNIALDWSVCHEFTKGDLSAPSIHLVNIGFGAAKKVEAKWVFDYENLMKDVNHLAQKHHQGFYIEKENSFLKLKSENNGFYHVNAEMNIREYEYLLPLSHDSGREIVLPPSYTMLLSMYLSLWAKEHFSFQEIEVPTIKLELNYQDIGKGKHASTHTVACELFFIETPAAEDKEGCPKFSVKLIEIS